MGGRLGRPYAVPVTRITPPGDARHRPGHGRALEWAQLPRTVRGARETVKEAPQMFSTSRLTFVALNPQPLPPRYLPSGIILV